ncbi:hypothetical protein SLEP1_g20725 [Rubroshorea leprosula]|uniref:Plastocyanin-like domain-containing protein n=1 Tax=Rubroshorea leprosula TaxID=152421 RepID=A0AAV5JB65_9ROSI|nr:hypothetical protein SLEP1_g20725 [Rubroshorea leprosula]
MGLLLLLLRILLGIGLFKGMLLFSLVGADVHYYDFVTKSMVVVNESFPGSVIHVRKGDTAYIDVHNQGPYGVTLQWHGVKQHRNPWSDGPAYVTQCQVEPNTNFTYEVIFISEDGTLWWHAHSDWTRSSVHGAIVIHPTEGTT